VLESFLLRMCDVPTQGRLCTSKVKEGGPAAGKEVYQADLF
jgi:hypothetical protein